MHRLYIFIFLTSLFLGCKKDKPISAQGTNFVGHRQYQYEIGGLTGAKTYPPGAATTILFLNNDKTYQWLTYDKVQQTGIYNISSVKSVFSGNNDNAIDFDSSGTWKIITIQKDTLSIADNFADGYGQVYYRIK